MKKLISLLLVVAVLFSFTACGSTSNTAENAENNETETETEKVLGMLAQIGVTEEEANALKVANQPAEEPEDYGDGSRTHYNVVKYYDTFSTLQMAFDSDQVDAIEVPKVVADYMVSQGESISMTANRMKSYSMLTADSDLADRLSEAIVSVQEDGTLDSLIVKYLTSGATMDAVEFETFEGAETLTFAVTGDLPPFDYTDESGNAAGFNTAMIAAVASRMGVNVEIIQVDSGARALALSSGKADVVFWMSDDDVQPDDKASLDYSDEDLTFEFEEGQVDIPATIDESEVADGSAPEDAPARTDCPEGTYKTNAFFFDYSVTVEKK